MSLRKNRFLISFQMICMAAYADTGYVTEGPISGGPGQIFSFDTQNPMTPVPIATMPASAASFGLAFRETSVYVTDGPVMGGFGSIYTFDSANPTTPIWVASMPMDAGQAGSIAIVGATAFIADASGSNIYSFNTAVPTTPSLAVTLPMSLNAGDLAAIGDAVYIAAGSGGIYTFNASSPATPTFLANLPEGVSNAISALGTNLYVTDANNPGNIYVIDTTNPTEATLVTTMPTGHIAFSIAFSGTTAYVADPSGATGEIYTFDTTNPDTPSLFLTMPTGHLGLAIDFLPSMGFFSPFLTSSFSSSQISTVGLSGQLLVLANYLNSVSPSPSIQLLANLSGGSLVDALKLVSPARNAIPIFAAENALFSIGQMGGDHLRQQRFSRRFPPRNERLAARSYPSELFADASDKIAYSTRVCDDRPFSIWAEGIGSFTQIEAQNQTPGFQTRLGGAIAAIDYFGVQSNPLGGGFAYTYSKIDEEGGAGHATLNQEFAVLYGTISASEFYAVLWLTGGLFQIENSRNISFPGFDATAKSDPKGWQLAPQIDVGIDFDWCWGTIEPFALFDWANIWEEAFTEQGADGLNMSQKSHYSSLLRSEVGVRFYQAFFFEWGHLALIEKGSYVNKTTFQTGRVTAFLVGSSSSFTVETFKGDQNLGVGEFELLIEPVNTRVPYVRISYQGEFGTASQSNQIMLALGKDF